MTNSPVSGQIEMRMRSTASIWYAQIEAQGDDFIRVRIDPDELGIMPSWAVGTILDCAASSGEQRYYAETSVMKQSGDTLWLKIPESWDRTERRLNPRSAGGFPVNYRCEGFEGVGACLDIGAGGMKIRLARRLDARCKLSVSFVLPGESLPLILDAMVIYCEPDDSMARAFNLGIKFLDNSPAMGLRISRYVGH